MGRVTTNSPEVFPVLKPNLQVSFYYRLQEVRSLYLHEALKETVQKVSISVIDQELSTLVNADALKKIALSGLRGEIFFPVPCLITKNPFLLGYYRLLLGFSQKEFYNKGPFGRFKHMEDEGNIRCRISDQIPYLCKSLIRSAEILVNGIHNISLPVVHELQLLTLGPQLRGRENTRLGQEASQEVYDLIRSITHLYIKNTTERSIHIENDSQRTVMIEFSSDPDVRIMEVLPSGIRPLVSIEIKGGTDSSNIHNRLGEAEKSHQKARQMGFFEFWTIIRVDIDYKIAKQESPTTSHFFHLDYIKKPDSPEHKKFRDLLCSLLGISERIA